MKKQVTKYFCDLCGKEVDDEKMLVTDCTLLGTRKVQVEGNKIRTSLVRVKNKDICSACASKLASMIEVDSKNNIKFVEPAVKASPSSKPTTTTKSVSKPTVSTGVKSSTATKQKDVVKTRELPDTRDMVERDIANKQTFKMSNLK